MRKDPLQYDKMVEAAFRDVVRRALEHAAAHGLPGNHHFYLTFKTGHAGVKLPEHISAQYPDEMTIVLQHQFWGLEVSPEHFEVTLSFDDVSERLTIPFAALTAFADPSANFGLKLLESAPARMLDTGAPSVPAPGGPESAAKQPAEPVAGKGAPEEENEEGAPEKIVSLDAFRKK